MNTYETIIGLEIHIQLKTKTGMFSCVSNDSWQAEPNSLTNPVELGLPGSLPTPNKTAIEWTQRFGKALNCRLNTTSKFDRKNYFYPDLPRGYQISQYDQPFCEEGYLFINDSESPGKTKKIRITRVHLEEDTGKSIHKNGKTYLNFNKAGTPLMELVTEPDFRSAEEASEFAKLIQEAARILDISYVDMEKGNMRLEANISVRKKGETELPNYRVEVKNINSFRFMRNAINYEVERQMKALEEGVELFQETRGWSEAENKTLLQRRKEDAHDYRYFPEPDIPPMEFDDEYFSKILEGIPEMPWEIERSLLRLGVRIDYAKILSLDSERYQIIKDYNENSKISFKEYVSVVVNTKNISDVESKLRQLQMRSENEYISDDELVSIVQTVINDNPEIFKTYRDGKDNVLKFLIGQVMKLSKGKADPIKSEQLFRDYL